MKIFSGSSNKPFSQAVAKVLGIETSPLEVSVFSDGERRIRILESAVGEDCIIVQPTASPADINYMELFFIADAVKRGGAQSITAVIPYLGYQRQNHLFRAGEAVSLEVIASTIQSVGVDRLITLDLHSVRIPEVFSIPVSHASALPLFAQVIKDNGWDNQDTVLVSPDGGGIRRVKILSELLNAMQYAAVEKNRDLATGAVEAMHVEGSLAKRAIIIDDMVSSGATVIKAAELLRGKGVEEVIVFATHGILASGASRLLQESVINKVYITDTVFIPEVKHFTKLEVLSVAEIIAEELGKKIS
jgi:ribose-phosphate pyrophosphokinase